MKKLEKLAMMAARTITSGMSSILPRSMAETVGMRLFQQSRGEGNDDPRTNGEYFFMRKLAAACSYVDPVIIDCGANIGDWTVQAARSFGPTGRIYSLEPTSLTHSRLVSRLGAASLSANVIPIQVALGAITGRARLSCWDEHSVLNSLHPRPHEILNLPSPRVEEIDVLAGDDFLKNFGLQKINFLKIDTEGHELSVLHGFRESINKQAIACIQFEYGGTWIDAKCYLKDAFSYLTAAGYSVKRLLPQASVSLDTITYMDENFHYANYVAVLPELKNILANKIGS